LIIFSGVRQRLRTGTSTDTINFSVSGTIALVGSTLPTILNTLTIDGTGQSITVDGSNSGSPAEILYVNSGATINVNDLTIANGGAVYFGVVVYNYSGATVTVSNSILANETTGRQLLRYDHQRRLQYVRRRHVRFPYQQRRQRSDHRR